MKIINLPQIHKHTILNTECPQKSRCSVPSSLAPLSQDTVSFGALKKSQFEGIDLAVVEKFKAPIEQFNSNNDLQNWASNQIDEILNKDFGGLQEETKIQRKSILQEWSDYVLEENDAYNNATALLILSAVTKGLKPDNDKLPPVLNKGVLADCIFEIDKKIKEDNKYQFNLNKMYETKLRAFYLESIETGESGTKWVVIPSEDNDFENFEENVEKLKVLSHKNWCTKSFNAEPYLRDGDFHVYLEDGKPKLGVRFVGKEVYEIQGELNNGNIPLAYYDVVKKHIQKENLQLSEYASDEVCKAEKAKKEVDKIKKELKEEIKSNNAREIFKYFGFLKKRNLENCLTLDNVLEKYKQPSESYTFKDLGIDENKLFEKVKCIKNNADFADSQVKNLGNLRSIGGYADFAYSQVKDLGNLRSIGGYADFTDSQIKDLGNLRSIGEDAYFENSKVENLGNLKSIGKGADFENSQVENLGNLRSIGEDVHFKNSQIKDLGKLKSISGFVYIDKDSWLKMDEKIKRQLEKISLEVIPV